MHTDSSKCIMKIKSKTNLSVQSITEQACKGTRWTLQNPEEQAVTQQELRDAKLTKAWQITSTHFLIKLLEYITKMNECCSSSTASALAKVRE